MILRSECITTRSVFAGCCAKALVANSTAGVARNERRCIFILPKSYLCEHRLAMACEERLQQSVEERGLLEIGRVAAIGNEVSFCTRQLCRDGLGEEGREHDIVGAADQ